MKDLATGPGKLRRPDTLLAPELARELASLHSDQRDAALTGGNLLMVAGPGAGKTRTVAARIAYLLATTSTRRGVAALSYTDKAASEVTERLRRLGIAPGRRLASGTVHSFCLIHILKPYARFTSVPPPQGLTVLDDRSCSALWRAAGYEAGFRVDRNAITELSKARRLLAVGQSTAVRADYAEAVRCYEQKLVESHAMDFDSMPIRALRVLRESKQAAQMLTARFPYLVVDEYQDMGPVPHAIALELLGAGTQLTALGDSDQLVFAFQGADSRYMEELGTRDDFTTIRLSVNFRSGSAIVAAGHQALGRARDDRADIARGTPGTVTRMHVTGGIHEHARVTAEMVRARIDAGTRAEDIAVLHRGGQSTPALLTSALERAGIACDVEKSRRIPDGPLMNLVSRCAARRLAGPTLGASANADKTDQRRAVAPHVRRLGSDWQRKLVESGHSSAEKTPRALYIALLTVLDAPDREDAPSDATAFMRALAELLDLDHLAAGSSDQRDRSVPADLRTLCEAGLTMAELSGERAPGQVAVTTYHSSKGREFDVVVLPCLVNGILPHYHERGVRLGHARNAFYVAVTRARHEVVLVSGDQYTDSNGRSRYEGPSPFLIGITAHRDDRPA
ncbi:ATP-dependent helicase [Embleya sp. NPDC050493]|uniref:ATP-dependent helicase n=1 Tax=Embleya sp. NPDC050493 TaxID=3363989 RepID=UPI003791F7B5